MVLNKPETREELARRFKEAMLPTEENNFKSHFHLQLMAPDQFAALVGGLDPVCYKRGHSNELPLKEFKKRARYATYIFTRIVDDIDKGMFGIQDLHLEKNAIYISTWKYIKWAAENKIHLTKLFLDQLSLTLLELFYEFQPDDTPLKTSRKDTLEYHKALYLKHAQEMCDKANRALTPTEIYNHYHMQGIQRRIRSYGGNYKKRTCLVWLSTLNKRLPGRPKKPKI